MIKKLSAVILCVLMLFSFAHAESFTWMFEGKVVAGQEHSLLSPFSGNIKAMDIQPNMSIQKGKEVFELEPETAYAPVDGTIGIILAKQGDALANMKELYKASLFIETDSTTTIKCTHLHNSKPYEFSVAHLGEIVQIRNRSDESQIGEGEIIERSSKGFTVRLTSGDLRFNSRVYIYRSKTYEATKRLGSGTVSRNDPVAVNAEGTMVKLLCKTGDMVKAGDPLFYYTKSAYNGEDFSVKMPQDGIITKVEKKLGDAIDMTSPVAIYILNGEKYVSTKLNENEVNKLKIGDEVSATADSLGIENIKCKIQSIAAIPDDKGLYEVIIGSQAIKDFRIGTTLSFTVGEQNK